MTTINRISVADYYTVVSDALGRRRGETLAAAAFRVLRFNCADPVTLDVARLLCAHQGMAPDAQQAAIERGARMIWDRKTT